MKIEGYFYAIFTIKTLQNSYFASIILTIKAPPNDWSLYIIMIDEVVNDTNLRGKNERIWKLFTVCERNSK